MGEQGWRSGESTHLPPIWPGFESWRRRHMWVEFVVGSLPCSERFFYGYSGFLVFKNQHFQIPIRSGTHGHVSASSYELLSDPWVNKLHFTIYNFYDDYFSSETQFCFRTYNTKWHTQMEELQDIALQSKDSLTRKTTNPISA